MSLDQFAYSNLTSFDYLLFLYNPRKCILNTINAICVLLGKNLEIWLMMRDYLEKDFIHYFNAIIIFRNIFE